MAMVKRHTQEELPDVEVFEVSAEEYERAVETALKELGLSYRRLRKQARRRQFSSPEARKLWMLIGEQSGKS